MRLRDHPHSYCLRMTVSKPDPGNGFTHSHVGVEGPIDARVGEFLVTLGGLLSRLTEAELKDLDDLALKIRTRAGIGHKGGW